MSKMRVHEVAKQLNVSNDEVIDKLKKIGVSVNSHMNTVEVENVEKIKNSFNKKNESVQKMHKNENQQKQVKPTNINVTNNQNTIKTQEKPKNMNLISETKEELKQENKPESKPEPKPEPKQNQQSTNVQKEQKHKHNNNYKGNNQNNNFKNNNQKNFGNKNNFNDKTKTENGQNDGVQNRQNQSGGNNQWQQNRPKKFDKPFEKTQEKTYDGKNYQNKSYSSGGNSNNKDGFHKDGNQNRTNTGYQNKPNNGYPNKTGYNKDGINRDGFNKDGAKRQQTGVGFKKQEETTTFLPQSKDKGREKKFTNKAKTTKTVVKKDDIIDGVPVKKAIVKKGGVAKKDYSPVDLTKKGKKAKKKLKPTKTLRNDLNQNVDTDNDIKVVKINEQTTITTLASKTGKSTSELIMALMKNGMMVNQNQYIDFSTATDLLLKFNIIAEKEELVDILEEAFVEETEFIESVEKEHRPPVVVVMGHVDHGKTSLLDTIKNTNVIKGEAGGITQHIGAYTVKTNGKLITFLDTPGHEAFTAMRMRGAQVTDIAILVVAADDGVMPQTIEAISHAKNAGVEIIVAINKIDKPSANPDRVKQELTEHGILVEEWGGDVICVNVSALKNLGIDDLLEMILLASDVKDLKAPYKTKARGAILEAYLDKGRGPVSHILVQSGTLKVGDPIVAGSCYGKVRAMTDERGNHVKFATPSIPVEILGLSEAPKAGDLFYVANSDKHARQLAESVKAKSRVDLINEMPQKVSLDSLFDQIQLGNIKDLNVIIKGDVQGSVEAVRTSIEKLSNEEVRIKAIHCGVGTITETDVSLAATSNAIIIAFGVKTEVTAQSLIEEQKVDVRTYDVIYKAIEDIEIAMKGLLAPVYEEQVIGNAEIRQIFKSSKDGNIAGSMVTDGKITRNSLVRISRDGKQIFDGKLSSLKRFKDEVKEVAKGYECGLTFEKFGDIKENDTVLAYIMVEKERN